MDCRISCNIERKAEIESAERDRRENTAREGKEKERKKMYHALGRLKCCLHLLFAKRKEKQY